MPPKDPPAPPPKCGFHGPNGVFVIEADLRAAVVAAAVAEQTIWFDSGSKKLQKEDNDKRFGDLVRYWLAGHTGTIRPGKLEAVQQAALDPGVKYDNLGNATLNTAIQTFSVAEAKVNTRNADVYTRSDEVDSATAKVKAADAQVRAADASVKTANTEVKRIEARVRDARRQSGAGAQAALDAEKAALSAATTTLNTKRAALSAAQQDRSDAQKALDAATTTLKAAKRSYEQAKTVRNSLKGPAQNWKATDKQNARKAILAKAGSTDPQKINDRIEEDLQLAHQSRADIEAWSAVFVVSCVRAAAINLKLEAIDSSSAHRGQDGLLMASRRHSDYIVVARERKRKAVGGTYHAFEPTDRIVQIGDIICTDRKDFINKPMLLKDLGPRNLQGDIVKRVRTEKEQVRGELHGDIVTQIKTENGKLFAETIGGNVGHTVRRRRYPLNAQGRLVVSKVHLYAQENDQGAFGDFKTLPSVPTMTMLPASSTGRIFALLSLVEECKPAPAGKSAPVGKQERFINQPIESLESPFLDEEILQPQPGNEFESGIERLTAGSPFLGALDARYSLEATSEGPFLQGFAEDFSSLDEPETREVGEIEEVELREPFSAEPEPEAYEDLATEESAEHFLFIEEDPLNEEREELEGFLVSDEEAPYEEEDERIDRQPEMLECSPTADEAQQEEFEELESNLDEFYLDGEETGSEFEDEDFEPPSGAAHDARIVQSKARTEIKPAEVTLTVDRWEKAEAAKVSGVRLKVYECDIGESGRSDAATASDIQIAEFTLDLAPNPEFVKNPTKAAIPRVVVVNAKWANAALEKSYKATRRTDITLWLGKRAFHLWIPRVDIMEEGSAAEIGFVIEDREGHKVERMSIAQGHIASVSLPDYLKVMIEIPGRFDDPKRDAAVDMDGMKFDEFLKGKNRREFIAKWLDEHPALKEAANEPGANLKTGDIIKAWFVIHDVGAKASLKDKRYRANQPRTKKGAVHGFLNRAGYYAATHDFNTNKQGTVYEFLSKEGLKIAGERTINIETVPDIEAFVRDKTDGSHGEPSNTDQYASIGYKPAKKNGVKGVTYYMWTKAAFDVLADLYIFASARARHLLTITAHKEMDRNLARSVIWREYSAAQIRSGTGEHWTTVRDTPSNYHGDPYGFNMQALYDLITQKLNALGGKQMPAGARYGIHPRRVCKADGEDIVNGSHHLHEFPHQSDPVVKSDRDLKREGWWKAS